MMAIHRSRRRLSVETNNQTMRWQQVVLLTSLAMLLWTMPVVAQEAATGSEQSAAQAVDPATFPEVVAKVGEQSIGKKELLTQAEILRAQVVQAGGQDPGGHPAFYREVLEGLVGEALVYQDALARGAAVGDADVEARLTEMAGQFADAAAFDQALAQQGTDRGDLRRQLRQSLTLEKVIAGEIGSQVQVGEEAKRSFYERNQDRMGRPEQRRVRHIMVRAPRSASPEVREEALRRAQDLLRRIEDGDDFATTARHNSEDQASSNAGGELGWVVRTGRRPEFEQAAFSQLVGQVSQPVETAAGYHLVEVLEIRPADVPSYESLAPRIEAQLRAQTLQREVQRRVETLRASTKVEIFL